MTRTSKRYSLNWVRYSQSQWKHWNNSLIKIDLLSTAALQKIQVCLGLLCEYGYIEEKPTLKETYEEAIGIYKLDRENPEMWKMANKGKVLSLFQMEKQSGVEGMRLVKPKTVESLATLNSVIRLAAQPGKERPLEKFQRFSEDPTAWEREMDSYELTEEEKDLLKEMFNHSHGISAQQEDLYQLMVHPKIAGYSFGTADKLRKAVAKKTGSDFDDFEEQFFKDTKERGSSPNLVNYVWNEMVIPQKGYSFNLAHTLGYSLVALQEMNLAYFYPTIFWNTANLIVDSGGYYDYEVGEDNEVIDDDEELELEKTTTDYSKVAQAIGRIQTVGTVVLPPNINTSNLTYTPNVKDSTINYGLMGISRVGTSKVEEIMNNRPYSSMEDFLEKVKVNKTQMISLIKSGAFDDFGDRTKLMKEYIYSISDTKKKLNLRNANMLIVNDLLPKDELDMEIRVFNYNKYIRKFLNKETGLIQLDDIAYPFYEENFDMDKLIPTDEGIFIDAKVWKSIYDSYTAVIREYIKAHHDELLEKLNDKLIEEQWEKYATGGLAKWSMDSVSFYQGEHELDGVDLSEWGVVDFSSLPEDPVVDYSFTTKDGKEINMFKMTRIAGTVINKNKSKSLITLLTTDGVVEVQAYGVFNAYDKQISRRRADGTKKVVEKSWFSRGTKIIVNGMRRGNMFVAKKYRNDPGHHFYKIDRIENGVAIIKEEREQM